MIAELDLKKFVLMWDRGQGVEKHLKNQQILTVVFFFDHNSRTNPDIKYF